MTKFAERQVAGIYRRRIGDMLVTTVNDGFLDIPFSVLRGAETEAMQTLMRKAYRNSSPRLTVNAFVIQTGKHDILVDAGGGTTTIYSMGRMPENLKAAGLSPADIDIVLLTHIHPDHSSGLMDPQGKPMFPNARIVVHEDDLTFWSDPGLRDGRSPAATPYLDSADMVIGAYRKQFQPSRGGEIVPGITLLPLPGHTPGHSGYRVDSAGETLVMWGDTVHVPEIQVPLPFVTNEYDISEPLAAENRRKILELVESEHLLITGGHLHLPGFAHVERDGNGFRLVPEPWQVEVQ